MSMRRLQTVLALLVSTLLLLAFTGCTREPDSFSAQVTVVPSLTPVPTIPKRVTMVSSATPVPTFPKPETVDCHDGPCGIATMRALNDSIEREVLEPRPDEESGLAPDTVYDEEVAFAVRLVLSYDATAGTFKGTVTNIARDTLSRLRVEVRLDGSDDRVADATLADLAPGQPMEVSIPAGGEPFGFWEVDTEIERIHRLD